MRVGREVRADEGKVETIAQPLRAYPITAPATSRSSPGLAHAGEKRSDLGGVGVVAAVVAGRFVVDDGRVARERDLCGRHVVENGDLEGAVEDDRVAVGVGRLDDGAEIDAVDRGAARTGPQQRVLVGRAGGGASWISSSWSRNSYSPVAGSSSSSKTRLPFGLGSEAVIVLPSG